MNFEKFRSREQVVGNEKVRSESTSRTASNSSNKISRPSDEKDVQSLPDRERFSSDDFLNFGVELSFGVTLRKRYVSFALSEVVALRVMDVMTPLPGVVGHKERGM